jgi:hypothetical protein
MSSTGNNPDFIRHHFKLSKELKSYLVYENFHVTNNAPNLLTELIRIEKFQGKSNATNINDYLRLKTTTNWATSEKITGLRPTKKEVLFYGDWLKSDKSNTTKKTLLIFVFFKNRNVLLIDVYRGFYPFNKEILQTILNKYETHL